MVKTYRKIPHEIQAIKFERSKQAEIIEFCPEIKIITPRHPNGKMIGKFKNMDEEECYIITEGEYLIKNKHGYHKYNDYVFNRMYEEVENV